MRYDWQFKTVLIGDAAVGKTSIRRNYLGKGFRSSHIATIGVDFAQKYIQHDSETIRFIIWDLAGQYSYERVRRHYYQGASSIILVYSTIDVASFDNIGRWLMEANRYMRGLPPVAILANKIDLRPSYSKYDIVSTEKGEWFAQRFREKLEVPAIFKETSALTGENIQETFSDLIEMMLEVERKQS
jgi:small GTP-binding protein